MASKELLEVVRSMTNTGIDILAQSIDTTGQCPKCNSENIIMESIRHEANDLYEKYICVDCGCEYEEEYKTTYKRTYIIIAE